MSTKNSKSVTFDPATDMPSLEGKVIFVTGGTAGIGKALITALIPHRPQHIYFTGRNTSAATALINHWHNHTPSTKAAQTQTQTQTRTRPGLTFIPLDMTSLRSVRTAIRTHFTHPSLDMLFCNAGIMGTPPGLSDDGYEVQFAVNHVAHAMMLRALLPALVEAQRKEAGELGARVVVTASGAWQAHPKGGVGWETLGTGQDGFMGPLVRYGQSKLANILYASELARRYPQLAVTSAHPGVVDTDMASALSLRLRVLLKVMNRIQGVVSVSPDEASRGLLWLAAGAKRDELVNGGYYVPVGVCSNHLLEKDGDAGRGVAERLWAWTEEVLDKAEREMERDG